MAVDGVVPASDTSGQNRRGAGGEDPSGQAHSQLIRQPSLNSPSPELSLFAGDLVKEAEAVVTNLREGKISRSEAVGQLFGVFDLAGSHFDIDSRRTAFQQFCSDIEMGSEREEEAGERGRQIVGARQQRDMGLGGGAGESRADVEDFFADLGQFVRKRPSADNYDDDDDDVRSERGKRARLTIDRRSLPWNKHGDARPVVSTNPGGVENRKLLHVFLLNPTSVVSDIRLNGYAPPFPQSEWGNIIRGLPVSLDNVRSSLHHVNPVRESVARLGDSQTEITFSPSKPSKIIESTSDWHATWTAKTRAYTFVFKHRRDELDAYGEYIMQLFASKVLSAAPKVILYDKAIRNLVAGGQCYALTDTGCYSHLREAILVADGIEAQASSSGSRGKSGRNNGGCDPICERYNRASGCTWKDGRCKYRHVCKSCGGSRHGQASCEGGGGKEA